MMKKNLFLLFSLYFFVLQALFIWFLRWESNFFLLAAINFVFILLIALISKEKKSDLNENISADIEKTTKKKIKKTYKPIHHAWFFVISILFWFFVWFWLSNIVLHLQLLISIAASFVLFILFGILFRFKSLKVWEWKIYMIFLILLLVWSGIKTFNINIPSLDDEEITNTWINNFVSVDDDLSGDLQDNIIDGDLIEMDLIDPDTKATFDDVIVSLLDWENLNTNKNIRFTYVPYSSENYPYYRTAYDKKMIGKTINPEKELFCETYVVMKGLVEWRSVWTYWDIKLAYWNYAEENDLLPSCEYGEYLTVGDLK